MGNVSTTSQALTTSNSGDRTVTQGVVTLSSSYAAGGDAAIARQFGLGYVQQLSISQSTGGYELIPIGPPTAGTSFTVAAMRSANQLVVATSTTGLLFTYTTSGAVGLRTTIAADIALAFEATAGTNLSGVSARFRAEGY